MNASIDIGSNSTILLVGEFKNREFVEKCTEVRITGLGKGINEKKEFQAQSMADTFDALKEYSQKMISFGVKPENAIVTSTEAARVSKNSQEFFGRVEKELGLRTQILNAEGEAYYTALGISLGPGNGNNHLVIMDIGGASTELISIQLDPFRIKESISLPVGSVRATDALSDDKFSDWINESMSSFSFNEFHTDRLLCVAGTMTSLGAMLEGLDVFNRDIVHGLVFPVSKLNNFIEKIKDLKTPTLKEEYPVIGKRAGTIVGGIKVAQVLGEKLGVQEFEISTYGLRYGTLFEGEINSKYLN